MSPHRSAIFLQHSRSAEVIAAPGKTQAATGSAANMSARTETPTLINSFNITSLPTSNSKTQPVGKGFSLRPSRTSANPSFPGRGPMTHRAESSSTPPGCTQSNWGSSRVPL
jgi:hypothetical protein